MNMHTNEHIHKHRHTYFLKFSFIFESKQQQFKMYWNHKSVSEDTSIGNERLEKNPKETMLRSEPISSKYDAQ